MKDTYLEFIRGGEGTLSDGSCNIAEIGDLIPDIETAECRIREEGLNHGWVLVYDGNTDDLIETIKITA